MALELTLGTWEHLNHKHCWKNKEMTIAGNHISEYKFFASTDQCLHSQQREKVMTTSEEMTLQISKLNLARVLKMENNTLETCLLLLSN